MSTVLEPYWNTNYGYCHSHRQHFDYLGQADIGHKLAFINEGLLKLNCGDIAGNADLIHRCRKETNRLPVLALDTNPHDVTEYLNQLYQYIDPGEFFVFGPDARTELFADPNLAAWPSFLCNQQLVQNFQLNYPKKYRISYLSGTLRYHRLKLFKDIKPWVQHNDIVVINCFTNQNFYNTIEDTPVNIDEYIADLPWQSIPGLIDSDQNAMHASDHQTNCHPAYAACVNITGETASPFKDQVFVTEKTWKAYVSGCLVINFGVKDLPSTLSNFGIEIWSEYDGCDHIDDKICSIVDLFQRDDIFELYRQKQEMVKYNQNLVCSKQFVKNLAMPAIEKLKDMI